MTNGVRRHSTNVSHTFIGGSVVAIMWRSRVTVITALSTDSGRVVGWGQRPLHASLLATRRGYLPVSYGERKATHTLRAGSPGLMERCGLRPIICHFLPFLCVLGEQRHWRHTGLGTTQPKSCLHLSCSCRCRREKSINDSGTNKSKICLCLISSVMSAIW